MMQRVLVLALVVVHAGSLPVQSKPPDVKYVPTPQEVVHAMLKLAEVKKGELVCDPGCGDARILVTAARKYRARGLGIDIDPIRYRESKANVKANGVEHLVTITFGDMFKVDFHEADVVTLYLGARLNQRLLPQLRKLKPGARIVSYDYDIEGIAPRRVVKVPCKDGVTRTIYLWVTPLNEPYNREQAPAPEKKHSTAKAAPGTKVRPEPVRASIWVWVPADATLWFDGDRTTATGRLRHFQSPPLEPGQRYRYRIEARWREKGREVRQTQHITLVAGDDAVLTFPTPSWHEKLAPPPPVSKP